MPDAVADRGAKELRLDKSGEIIADLAKSSSEPSRKSERMYSEKNFNNVDNKVVKKVGSTIGTSGAQFGTVMYSESAQSSLASALVTQVREVKDISHEVNVGVLGQSESETAGGTASRTLSVVRDVVEHVRGSGRRTIELSLRLPEGETLSLQIQMRGGVAHTTFRTDSPELREALAQEWQNTMPTHIAGEVPIKLAEPSFVLGPSSEQENSLNSDGSRQQQGQPSDHSEEFGRQPRQTDSFASSANASRRVGTSSDQSSTHADRELSDQRPATSRRLHTFA